MNLGILSQLAFINPWILASALILPVLWFLLRVTPPAPRRIFFPATRFLKDLIAQRTTPSKTPWWLLLLRCLMVACVIFALAKPVLNAASDLPGQADIRIIVDTGWEAAQNWRKQIRAAEQIIAQAEREKRAVYIMTTTLQSGQTKPYSEGPMSAGQAQNILRGLEPNSWPANYNAVAAYLKDQAPDKSIMSFWMGSGLSGNGFNALTKTLQNQGGLHYYEPERESMPVLLRNGNQDTAQDGLSVSVDFADKQSPSRPFTIHALNANNGIAAFETMTLNANSDAVSILIPDPLTANVAKIKLIGVQGAGGALLLDDQHKKRSVGIINAGPESDPKPFIDAVYYLKRALEPYSVLTTAPLDDLIEANPSVIIMPDIGALPPTQLNNLEKWLKDGGLLLRFAGDAMSAADNFLTPVPLRKGSRALDGEITWTEPQAIAPFPDTSPLYDIALNEQIMVRQQILAEPVADLDDKTWARLDDGTPIITASALDRGLVVLVHTTAGPSWSDLPLSGSFVQILRRIISLSNAALTQDTNKQSLQPISVMNGQGELIEPKNVKPIMAQDFASIIPSADHPPGLYGTPGQVKVLNLGERLKDINAVSSLPSSVKRLSYDQDYELDLMPLFFSIALALLLLDWIIMIAMTGRFQFAQSFKRFAPAIIIGFMMVCLYSPSAQAQSADDIRLAGDLYMGFIKSGDPQVDDIAERGLDALATVLTQRTSVEPQGTVALDPESDELAFFPFLYWPVTATPRPLSDQALENIQNYLDHGGTILFDTRDQNFAASNTMSLSASENARSLRQMISGLNIPSLVPTPKDHVLHKSFYLLKDFPGRYTGGQVWVEAKSANGRDGVSSVLIGGHDWAAAWAAESNGGGLRPYLNGGPRQQEMAFRFGVNMMMYALTGNYKADQVHLPHILERLDQ